MICQQHAGAFFLSCKFVRTLPVALSSVYGVVSTAGPGAALQRRAMERPAAFGRSRPTGPRLIVAALPSSAGILGFSMRLPSAVSHNWRDVPTVCPGSASPRARGSSTPRRRPRRCRRLRRA